MRRSEKAVTGFAEMETILRRGQICQLAIVAEPAPYLVSLNYGYAEGVLYFHSALVGRKIELLQKNPRAAFTVAIDGGLIRAERACSWSNRFASVVGYGKVSFLETTQDKRSGLDRIMQHYSAECYDYPAEVVAKTQVWKIEIEEMTAKQSQMEL